MTPYWPREWESFVIILDKAGFSHKGVVVIDHNQGFAQVGAEAWTVGSQQHQVSDWGQVWSEPPESASPSQGFSGADLPAESALPGNLSDS